MNRKPIIAIAGLDPTGGAGILMDARVFAAYGRPCAGAITAIADQTHERGVEVHPTSLSVFQEMLDCALDTNPAAVKIGMLTNSDLCRIVFEKLSEKPELPTVLDPVIRSSSGMSLLDKRGVDFLKSDLIRIVDLITPNWAEAAILSGRKIVDLEAATGAGRIMFEKYGVPALVTGGHSQGDPVDILVDKAETLEFSAERVSGEFRGTGCALSSMITAELADGKLLQQAILSAKESLAAALAKSTPPYITFSNC